MDHTVDVENPETEQVDFHLYDRKAIDRDIANGAKAGQELLRNANMDWTRWSALILGLRGLRTIAFDKAGTNDMKSQVYRDAMGSLLRLQKHSTYNNPQLFTKQVRSEAYRLMDRLDEINDWYNALPVEKKLLWKHPAAIASHAPKNLVKGGMKGHNMPPPNKVKKKPQTNAETERLRQVLVMVIQRLIKLDPSAVDLLELVHPPAEPDVPAADDEAE